MLLALAVALLAALPYLHGIDNEFIALDDDHGITNNLQVTGGLTWKGAQWATTTFHQGHWHPLTWLSHMVDVSLFGLDPWGHHLVNILLHALNATLLFVALFHLTGSLWPSAFVSVLFGVHPLHVESVAWITERRDVLAGLFFALVLLAYARYTRRGRLAGLFAVSLLLALGLTAKSMLVTVPFVLILLDLWPLGRSSWVPPADGGVWTPSPWSRLLLEKAPLFALSLAASVLAYLAQREAGAVADLDSIPPGMRAANAVVSYATHLGKTIWPSGLVVLYPHPPLGHAPLRILWSVLLLVSLSWGVLSRFRRMPFLAVGWLWFLGMLVPVIGLVQAGPQAMADRHTYLPLVGLFIAVAWGIPRFFPKAPNRALLLGASACAVVLLLSWVSWVQVGHWKDSRTLFERTLSLTSDNWHIENNLGVALEQEGRLDQAIVQFREASRLQPEKTLPRDNLANALISAGRLEEAIVQFREVVRLKPDDARAHHRLASALINGGMVDEAIFQFREALRLGPDSPETRYSLGSALFRRGSVEEAAAHAREALRLRPEFPEAHESLGIILATLGKPAEAVAHFREAIRLRPGPDTHYNLGNVLVSQGNLDGAVAEYREALRLQPYFPDAHNNLGNILVLLEEPEEAIIHFREALRLQPKSSGIHYNLGKVLASRGQLEDAIAAYREALRIRPDMVEAHMNLAALLNQLGRHEEAGRHLDAAGGQRGTATPR